MACASAPPASARVEKRLTESSTEAEAVQKTSGSPDLDPSRTAPSKKDGKETGKGDAAHEAQAKVADLKASPDKDGKPRIGALGPHTWIWKKPARKGLAIGKMRIGTSVVLKSKDPVDGVDCKGKWYAIEPRGYVCDDDTATLNLDDAWYQTLAFSAPGPGIWPYRYAHSNGAPMYSRVPTKAEWEKQEKEFGPVNTWKPLGAWAKGHEELIMNEPIAATDPVPSWLENGKRTAPGGNFSTAVLVWRKIPPGSMLSYSRAFEANGRVWLLTPDAMIVPADRVSQQKRSVFHGVYFDDSEMRLPFAWNRSKEPIQLVKQASDGSFEKSDETIAPKTPIEIKDSAPITKGVIEYFELRKEPGMFIARDTNPDKALDNPVTFTRKAAQLPKGIDPGEKWLEVKIVPGTLTAYVGAEPVMSTLFSPGKGGPPSPGHEATKYATTSTGFFPLEWKEHVATMSNEKGVPKVLWFTDVPHIQYLRAPLAMHVAYWHEDFGNPKSAECVNVSPEDGHFLFNPYSDRHSCFAESDPGKDGLRTNIRGAMAGVGQLCYYSRSDVDCALGTGWNIVSLEHCEHVDHGKPGEPVHAEWRVIARKI